VGGGGSWRGGGGGGGVRQCLRFDSHQTEGELAQVAKKKAESKRQGTDQGGKRNIGRGEIWG